MLLARSVVKIKDHPESVLGKKFIDETGIIAGIFSADEEKKIVHSYIVYFYDSGITAEIRADDLVDISSTLKGRAITLLMKASEFIMRRLRK